MKIEINKNNVSINKRLNQFAVGSRSVAVLAGAVGTAITADGSVVNLNLGTLSNKTFKADGTGTGGGFGGVYFTFADSSKIRFYGYNDQIQINGGNNAYTFQYAILSDNAIYYSSNSTVNGSRTQTTTAKLAYNGNNLGSWTTNRLNGAIGFKTGDDKFGFFRVSWVASTKTLTVLSGKIESVANTAIAVPEPAEYAAALGLGVIGLAYYRKRKGLNKRLRK